MSDEFSSLVVIIFVWWSACQIGDIETNTRRIAKQLEARP